MSLALQHVFAKSASTGSCGSVVRNAWHYLCCGTHVTKAGWVAFACATERTLHLRWDQGGYTGPPSSARTRIVQNVCALHTSTHCVRLWLVRTHPLSLCIVSTAHVQVLTIARGKLAEVEQAYLEAVRANTAARAARATKAASSGKTSPSPGSPTAGAGAGAGAGALQDWGKAASPGAVKAGAKASAPAPAVGSPLGGKLMSAGTGGAKGSAGFKGARAKKEAEATETPYVVAVPSQAFRLRALVSLHIAPPPPSMLHAPSPCELDASLPVTAIALLNVVCVYPHLH